MKTWSKFLENLGGLPSQAPNYQGQATQGVVAGARSGPTNLGIGDLGQVHLTLHGNSLMIDSGNHSIRLALTQQQMAQLKNELGGTGA